MPPGLAASSMSSKFLHEHLDVTHGEGIASLMLGSLLPGLAASSMSSMLLGKHSLAVHSLISVRPAPLYVLSVRSFRWDTLQLYCQLKSHPEAMQGSAQSAGRRAHLKPRSHHSLAVRAPAPGSFLNRRLVELPTAPS